MKKDLQTMAYVRIMRKLRKRARFSQQQVAEYLGTSQTMYSRYERAINEIPVSFVIALCELYNITADQLLGLQPLDL